MAIFVHFGHYFASILRNFAHFLHFIKHFAKIFIPNLYFFYTWFCGGFFAIKTLASFSASYIKHVVLLDSAKNDLCEIIKRIFVHIIVQKLPYQLFHYTCQYFQRPVSHFHQNPMAYYSKSNLFALFHYRLP